MLLIILAFIIPSVIAYTESDCNCETLLGLVECDWVNEMNPQTGNIGRVVCNNVAIDTELKDADLRGAVFNGVNFADGILPGQVFNAADVVNVDFRGASFTNVDFHSLRSVDFKFATFSSVKIHSSVSDTDFAHASGEIETSDLNYVYWLENNIIGTDVHFSGTVRSRLYSFVDKINDAYNDGVNAAYADGAASVTPEDGIGQSDVDAAVAALKASETGLVAAYKELKNC